MADLVKSVLGGAWSLIVGWVLPAFLSLQPIAWLVLPELDDLGVVHDFLAQAPAIRQATVLAVAAVLGIVLAAAQAPLYRVLQGTSALWPAALADRGRRRHRRRRERLVVAQLTAAQTDDGIRSGLLYERAARYPVKDKQLAPTAFGNAVRRFETYAGDRFQLDSQLLWHDLTAAAPDGAVATAERARTNVDFFVCLVWGGIVGTAAALAAGVRGGFTLGLGTAIAIGVVTSATSYRLAVLATDEWAAAVRAIVHHGRQGVAEAFGLRIPANIADERLMWKAVNTHVRRPYGYFENNPQAMTVLNRYRGQAGGQAGGGRPAG